MKEGTAAALGEVAQPGVAARRRRPRRSGRLDRLWLVSPGLLAYTCLVVVPIGISFAYSLTNYNTQYPDTSFVGLSNYADLLHDERFLQSLLVTAEMTLIIVILPNLVGLGLAVLLNRHSRLLYGLRALVFLPVVLSAVAVSFIWSTILTDGGVLNDALEAVGLGALSSSWLGNPALARISVAVVLAWQMVGFCAVIYLAALQAVPRELHEAAALDGASPRQIFARVTWPLIAPGLTINTVVLLITAFRLYDHVIILTDGGPGDATETLSTTIIDVGFESTRVAYASSMAIALLAILAVATAIALTVLHRREVQA